MTYDWQTKKRPRTNFDRVTYREPSCDIIFGEFRDHCKQFIGVEKWQNGGVEDMENDACDACDGSPATSVGHEMQEWKHNVMLEVTRE